MRSATLNWAASCRGLVYRTKPLLNQTTEINEKRFAFLMSSFTTQTEWRPRRLLRWKIQSCQSFGTRTTGGSFTCRNAAVRVSRRHIVSL